MKEDLIKGMDINIIGMERYWKTLLKRTYNRNVIILWALFINTALYAFISLLGKVKIGL